MNVNAEVLIGWPAKEKSFNRQSSPKFGENVKNTPIHGTMTSMGYNKLLNKYKCFWGVKE